jgi:hypothetical protein
LAAGSAPRRGFTIGTPNRKSVRTSAPGLVDRPSVPTGQSMVRASQNTHRPSLAGGLLRSKRPQGPPSHAYGHAIASRPRPQRGPKR